MNKSKSMSSHTKFQIIDLIKNLPSVEHQFNSDSIFDFVIDQMDGVNMYRFENIGSIMKWLCDGDGGNQKALAVYEQSKWNTNLSLYRISGKLKIGCETPLPSKFANLINDFFSFDQSYTEK